MRPLPRLNDISSSLRSYPPTPFCRSWNLGRGLDPSPGHTSPHQSLPGGLLFLMEPAQRASPGCLPRLPGCQVSSREFLAHLPVLRWAEEGAAGFLERAHPAAVGACCRDAAWVYLELFLAVPGPQASRISASQLSRKPGLSAAKQDKNSFSCLLTELGKGAGYLPLPLL